MEHIVITCMPPTSQWPQHANMMWGTSQGRMHGSTHARMQFSGTESGIGRAECRAACGAKCRAACRANCRAECQAECRAECQAECRAAYAGSLQQQSKDALQSLGEMVLEMQNCSNAIGTVRSSSVFAFAHTPQGAGFKTSPPAMILQQRSVLAHIV